jgi:LEA14-like dessication related protein
MVMNGRRRKASEHYCLMLLLVGCALFGCSTMGTLARIQKPQLEIQKVLFKNISLAGVDLEFDVKIKNPNDLTVTVLGFDYDFMINEVSFLAGEEKARFTVEALEERIVSIPLRLYFNNLSKALKALKGRDTSTYTLASKLYFAVPLLGRIAIPVSKHGELPLLRKGDNNNTGALQSIAGV